MRVEKTYKVVYNACFGGFDLSKKAKEWLKEHDVDFSESDFEYNHRLRSHPLLVECVETLGDDVNVGYTKLCVAEVPVGEGYYIHEYDGNEEVITKDDFVYPWTENDVTLNTTEVEQLLTQLRQYHTVGITLGRSPNETLNKLIKRLEGRK